MANVVYVSPGGVGSALELLMVLQLRQVDHIEPDFPIMVHPFWSPMLNAMQQTMHDERAMKGKTTLVKSGDLRGIIITDDIPEIVKIVGENQTAWQENIHSRVQKREQTKLF